MPVTTTDPEPATWYFPEDLHHPEGKTQPYIYDEHGHRITAKLKYLFPEKQQIHPDEPIHIAALVELSSVPLPNWRGIRVKMHAFGSSNTSTILPTFESTVGPTVPPVGAADQNTLYFLFLNLPLPTNDTYEFRFWVEVRHFFRDPRNCAGHGVLPPVTLWPEQKLPQIRLNALNQSHMTTGFMAGVLKVHTKRTICAESMGNEAVSSTISYGDDALKLIYDIMAVGIELPL